MIDTDIKKSTSCGGVAISGENSINENNNTVINNNQQEYFIASLLGKGEENKLSIDEIMKITGLSSERHIRLLISRERENGAIILSSRSSGGYFLPADGEQGKEEIRSFVQTLTRHANSIHKVLKSSRYALKKIDGQISLID